LASVSPWFGRNPASTKARSTGQLYECTNLGLAAEERVCATKTKSMTEAVWNEQQMSRTGEEIEVLTTDR